jgi:spore coat protein U-like protein
MKKGLLLGALLVAALLLSATFALADTANYANVLPSKATSGTVTATATVNPKITLQIVTPDPSQTVDFGAVDPGIGAPITKAVSLTVASNKAFDLTINKAGTMFSTPALHFSTSLVPGSGAKPGAVFNDTYSFQPDFNADAGNYNGTVQYTVTQQ